MGANLEFYRAKAKDERELKRKYADLVADAQYNDGHGGYTGTIAESPGLDIQVAEVFSTEDAENFIDECAKKWENSIAVRIKGTDDWVIGGVYSC